MFNWVVKNVQHVEAYRIRNYRNTLLLLVLSLLLIVHHWDWPLFIKVV